MQRKVKIMFDKPFHLIFEKYQTNSDILDLLEVVVLTLY